MRSIGTPQELERRRWLAVQRLREGYCAEEVADFLGVDPRSVRRWWAAFQANPASLAARAAPGRPPKLTVAQEKVVRRWLAESPTAFGFDTELWTAGRLARLIQEEFGTRFNPRYLPCWLRSRGFTPQKPQRVPRERDEAAIARWLAHDWARIKKGRAGGAPASP
ncbi:MAG TPA: winged helix-turn-helix domain-containing protein [Gemmataceae bacterium]|nr:winged helix-turn-helix domain-containing protein [Gemmataceae bacterium]